MVRLNSALLRRGLRIGSQHLLTVRGRSSGKPRYTPVSIATVGPDRYIVAAFEDAAWVANVRAAGTGMLSRGGTDEAVTFTELPVGDREPILRAFLEQVPGGVRFFEERTPDEVVAAAARYPVFRVEKPDHSDPTAVSV
jgi:deazaflavin-dependent oxidoreductase (nitroreductase family)